MSIWSLSSLETPLYASLNSNLITLLLILTHSSSSSLSPLNPTIVIVCCACELYYLFCINKKVVDAINHYPIQYYYAITNVNVFEFIPNFFSSSPETNEDTSKKSATSAKDKPESTKASPTEEPQKKNTCSDKVRASQNHF